MAPSLMMTQVEEQIKSLGFQHYGLTSLSPALSFDIYQSWIDEGLHGDMEYLKRHLPQKQNPEKFFPQIRSAIVVAQDYRTSMPGSAEFPLKNSLVAKYARGHDYHYWFKQKLTKLATRLKEYFPQELFFSSTDSAPILERDLAFRSGLGWFGKNTCLIDRRRGSFFLLGEVLTSLPLETAIAVSNDHCGTCSRCIEACPTQAFVEPRRLDARRCISYWTIESRSIPPAKIRSQMGSWLFGCDICQTVCPWNQKVFDKNFSTSPPASGRDLEEELRYILTSSNRKLMKDLGSTPLRRAGGFGLKRNAIIVATNRQCKNLIPEISTYLKHPKLNELAIWSLDQFQKEPIAN